MSTTIPTPGIQRTNTDPKAIDPSLSALYSTEDRCIIFVPAASNSKQDGKPITVRMVHHGSTPTTVLEMALPIFPSLIATMTLLETVADDSVVDRMMQILPGVLEEMHREWMERNGKREGDEIPEGLEHDLREAWGRGRRLR
jgi:hypothetical protein